MIIAPVNPISAHSLLSRISPAIIASAGQTKSISLTWTNDTGNTIFIYRGTVWCGVSKGDEGDISLWLADPRETYKVTNDDHYSDRDGIPNNEIAFDASPAYFTLFAGESLTLLVTVNADCGVPCVAQAFFQCFYVV